MASDSVEDEPDYECHTCVSANEFKTGRALIHGAKTIGRTPKRRD